MTWKNNFTAALNNFVYSKTQRICVTQDELMAVLDGLGVQGRRGIWKEVAQALHISKQQAHDYYYNSWFRQFFEDPKQYKQELRAMFVKNLEVMTEQDAVDASVNELIAKYHDKKFHRTSLLMLLYAFKTSKKCEAMKQ